MNATDRIREWEDLSTRGAGQWLHEGIYPGPAPLADTWRGLQCRSTTPLIRRYMAIHFDDPTKQEIWTTVREMNDAWTQGNPADLAKFFHEEMVAITPTDRLRLNGAGECIAGWSSFVKAARIHRWQENDPVINVFGDSAVVAYYFDMSFDMDGQTINLGGRDMFFFIKKGNRWWVVADQFSPYPA